MVDLDVGAAEVRRRLDDMLAAPPFVGSPQMIAFLRFVVDETLAGRSYRIKERTIAVYALGRPSDFDQRVNPSVRVLAGRVRRALALTPCEEGTICIEIPRGTYVPTFRVSRASVAGDGDTDPVSFAPKGDPVVAVGGFRVLDGEPTTRAVAAGLTDAVVQALVWFPGCRIVDVGVLDTAHHDEFEEVRSLATRCRADLVLAGSLHDDHGVLGVSARLLDGATGAIVWSEEYEAGSVDALAPFVLDVTAQRICAALADLHGVIPRLARLDGRSHQPTTYDAMAAFYQYVDSVDSAGVAPTLAILESVLARDRQNGLVTSMVAAMCVAADHVGAPTGTRSLAQATELIETALVTCPRDPYVAVNAALIERVRGRLHASAVEAERAAALAPGHPTVLRVAGVVLASLDRWDRGIAFIRSAATLNSHVPPGAHNLLLAIGLYRDGDFEAALADLPHGEMAQVRHSAVVRAAILARLGRLDEARTTMADADLYGPDLASRVDAILTDELWLPHDTAARLVDDLVGLEPETT
jgi:adenylate cyclase